MTRTTTLLLLLLAAAGCATMPVDRNPAAAGFLQDESDPQAIAIADAVMERLGGRDAWDTTRYLRWTFFGARSHVWDRQTNLVRIEGTRRDDGAAYVIIVDLDDATGRAWLDGEEVLDVEERRALLDSGRRAWINDSYWLVMPYKLKDTGVRLRSLGPGEMTDGRSAERLELTFRAVGDTPDNRYVVHVADDSGLIEQWDFYRDAADTEATFQIPWHDWTRYGRIMLSGNRGERELTNIAVLKSLPSGAFQSPAPIAWPDT